MYLLLPSFIYFLKRVISNIFADHDVTKNITEQLNEKLKVGDRYMPV